MTSFPKIGCRQDFNEIEGVALSELNLARSPYEILERSAQSHPNNIALGYLSNGESDSDYQCITYLDLLMKINQTANAFRQLGIEEKGAVAILLPNCIENHYCIWGGQATGIISPINPFLEANAIADIMNATKAKVLVTLAEEEDQGIWNKLSTVVQTVPSLKQILTVRLNSKSAEPSQLANTEVRDFESFISQQDPSELNSSIDPYRNRVSAYFHTGGTTGSPKIAQHSFSNQVFMAHSFRQMLKITESDISLGGLPLFHVNAIYTAGLALFSAGASALILGPNGFRNRACLADFWNIVDKFKATMVSGVPTVYSALLALPKPDKDYSLRVGVMGAAPASPELFKQVQERLQIEILEGYGLTEGTCLSSINPYDGEKQIGSIGLSIPYQEMKAVELNEQGQISRDCDTGESGVIVIRGPNVFQGYLQAEANKGVLLNDGWLNTGDIGREDEAGYFWLTGRAKDLIIRSGHNIDPKVIEDTLATHPEVSLVAAVGQPDSYAGELPCVYITLKAGSKCSSDTLLSFAKENIQERAAIPVHLEILNEMPVTAVGKIFKPALRSLAIERVLKLALSEDGLSSELRVENHPKTGVHIYTTAELLSSVDGKVKQFGISATIHTQP